MKPLFRKIIALVCGVILMSVSVVSVSAEMGKDDGAVRFPGDTSYISGDANNDYNVNILDLVQLKKHISAADVFINTYTADIDSNGLIEADDLVLLKKVLLQII